MYIQYFPGIHMTAALLWLYYCIYGINTHRCRAQIRSTLNVSYFSIIFLIVRNDDV